MQLGIVQPAKVEPTCGAAVRVTRVPCSYASSQSAPQSMPTGVDVTVPSPVPLLVTVSRCWPTSKVAVTEAAAIMLITQVPAPLHPLPDQPVKPEPVLGLVCVAMASQALAEDRQRNRRRRPQRTPEEIAASCVERVTAMAERCAERNIAKEDSIEAVVSP